MDPDIGGGYASCGGGNCDGGKGSIMGLKTDSIVAMESEGDTEDGGEDAALDVVRASLTSA